MTIYNKDCDISQWTIGGVISVICVVLLLWYCGEANMMINEQEYDPMCCCSPSRSRY